MDKFIGWGEGIKQNSIAGNTIHLRTMALHTPKEHEQQSKQPLEDATNTSKWVEITPAHIKAMEEGVGIKRLLAGDFILFARMIDALGVDVSFSGYDTKREAMKYFLPPSASGGRPKPTTDFAEGLAALKYFGNNVAEETKEYEPEMRRALNNLNNPMSLHLFARQAASMKELGLDVSKEMEGMDGKLRQSLTDRVRLRTNALPGEPEVPTLLVRLDRWLDFIVQASNMKTLGLDVTQEIQERMEGILENMRDHEQNDGIFHPDKAYGRFIEYAEAMAKLNLLTPRYLHQNDSKTPNNIHIPFETIDN